MIRSRYPHGSRLGRLPTRQNIGPFPALGISPVRFLD